MTKITKLFDTVFPLITLIDAEIEKQLAYYAENNFYLGRGRRLRPTGVRRTLFGEQNYPCRMRRTLFDEQNRSSSMFKGLFYCYLRYKEVLWG